MTSVETKEFFFLEVAVGDEENRRHAFHLKALYINCKLLKLCKQNK
jgi:hypothetical protein